MNKRQIFAVAVMLAAAGTVRAEPNQNQPAPVPAPTRASAMTYKARPLVRRVVPRPACTLINNCLVLVGTGP
jgi:hypothetical protein